MQPKTGMTRADGRYLPTPGKKTPVQHLPYERFMLLLRVRSLSVLPPYKGGIFRDAFGNALRNAICAMERIECRSCMLSAQCLYVALFEPEPPPYFPDAKKFDHAPPPYVLNPPLYNREVFRTGQTLSFKLVLMGRAIEEQLAKCRKEGCLRRIGSKKVADGTEQGVAMISNMEFKEITEWRSRS